MQRLVTPEILDELPPDDPRAVRSRKDLRVINFLMGNERWIVRQVLANAHRSVIELGAGGGGLAGKLAQAGHSVTGLDLQERPESLEEVGWRAGDLFQTLPETEGDCVVASLVLHHFEDDALARLGSLLASRRLLIFAEPLRSGLALAEGRLMFPFVGSVTRHDMIASIRAGFRRGELPDRLGLRAGWSWEEKETALGGLFLLGRRRPD